MSNGFSRGRKDAAGGAPARTAEPFDRGEGGGDGDFWQPADHIDQLHLVVCTGETTEVKTKYRDYAAAPVVSCLVVFDDDGPTHRFDELSIIQEVLGEQCADAGVRVGWLDRPKRAYVFVPPEEDGVMSQVNQWMAENGEWTGSGWECLWQPAEVEQEPRYGPEEAPF